MLEGPRVLVLAGGDVLDDIVEEWARHPGMELHMVDSEQDVDGVQETAAAVAPTHLVVRDGGGRDQDLDRCRAFVVSALAVTDATVHSVIQTHDLPQRPETHAYDRWLKRDAVLRPSASLCIIWHEPLTESFADCRGEIQSAAAADVWARVRRPSRLLGRQIFSGTHDLEYTATRNR